MHEAHEAHQGAWHPVSFGASLLTGLIILVACIALVVFALGRWLDSMWEADHGKDDRDDW